MIQHSVDYLLLGSVVLCLILASFITWEPLAWSVLLLIIMALTFWYVERR